MTADELAVRVLATFRSAVEEILGQLPDFEATTPIEDVGIDSLDLIEVGMIMEDEYGVEMTDKHFEDVKVVGDVLSVFADLARAADS